MIDALVPVFVALVAALYARGVQRCWAVAGHGRIIRPSHVLAAAGAFAALLFALYWHFVDGVWILVFTSLFVTARFVT